MEVQHVIRKGDSLEVVNVLRQEDRSWTKYGHLLEDAKTVLHNCSSWGVNQVKRDTNEAAHRVAKLALQLNETHV